jgi:hypothetical protein
VEAAETETVSETISEAGSAEASSAEVESPDGSKPAEQQEEKNS